MNINDKVKYYRHLKGFSQRDLAELLNMKRNTYAYLEREGSISCDIARRIAEILDIDIRLLFYEEIEINEKYHLENILSEIDKSKFFVILNDSKEARLLKLFQSSSEERKNVIFECVNSICNL